MWYGIVKFEVLITVFLDQWNSEDGRSNSTETSVTIYTSGRRHVPQDLNLQRTNSLEAWMSDLRLPDITMRRAITLKHAVSVPVRRGGKRHYNVYIYYIRYIYINIYIKVKWSLYRPSVACLHLCAPCACVLRSLLQWNSSLFLSLTSCAYSLSVCSVLLHLISQWHTHTTHTLNRIPLDEGSVCRRKLYRAKPNVQNRQTVMPTAGFEPAIQVN